MALVAQDDIAAAVAMLREPTAHAGRAYDLTGPEELALAEVAAVLSAVTGRAVLYVPATVEEALASRVRRGAGLAGRGMGVDLHRDRGRRDGRGQAAVPDLTGHPARTLEQLLRARP